MREYAIHLLYIVMAGMLFSCKQPANRENNDLIGKAQQALEQSPDSAFVLLSSINHTMLDARQYAAYILLKIEAKDKTDRDITEDTVIFHAKDYFVSVANNEKSALACFYAGRVRQEQGKEREALSEYLDAARFAETITNYGLKGRIDYYIGQINYEHGEYEEAMSRLKKSAQWYHLAGLFSHEAQVLTMTGNIHLLTGGADSATALYTDILQDTAHEQDTVIQALALHGLGVVYLWNGDYARAGNMYRQAIRLSIDPYNKARLQMNLVEIWFDSGRIDSIAHHAGQLFETLETLDDKPALLKLYRLMAQVETKKGNGDLAEAYLVKHDTCLNRIYREREKSGILELQKKYRFDKLQDEQAIERRNYAIALLGLTIVILLFIYWLYDLRRKNKLKEQINSDLLHQLDRMQLVKAEMDSQFIQQEHSLQMERDEAAKLKKKFQQAQENIKRLEKAPEQNAVTRDALQKERDKFGQLVREFETTKERNNKQAKALISRLVNMALKLEQINKEISPDRTEAEKKTVRKNE